MMDDDWGPAPPQGHPVIATLAGIALLVLAALLGPWLAPQKPLPALLIAGAALGLVLWLTGFVLTTRHAGLGWKFGSLALLIGAGIGAGAVAHGQFQTRARADASSFAELELGPDGAPRLPQGISARGPISKLYAEAVQADAREQRDFAAALGRFGLAALSSPYLLQQDPRAIGNCGALDAIKQTAAEQSRQRAARRAALARAIGAANLPGQAKQGIARIAGETGGGDSLLASQQSMLDTTRALCTLLARRSWTNDGGYFGFRNGADADAFKALKARQQAIADQQGAIERAARERFTEGRDQVRDALSRSIYAGD